MQKYQGDSDKCKYVLENVYEDILELEVRGFYVNIEDIAALE